MKLLRLLLFPLALCYELITFVRNLLFDYKIIASTSYTLPIIAVGNLSTGGTGKTPQIEYLIRLLADEYTVATLSRGYKRKSSGYLLADKHSTAAQLGDEPYQFFKKFPTVHVAVDANRKNGIENLIKLNKKPDLILLDDAFQHRKVTAGLYILLTTYDDLYANDYPLPTGNLRENKTGATRAKIIIVTKCPKEIALNAQLEIIKLLKITNEQHVFFSYINYDDKIYCANNELPVSKIINQPKLILAGVANPKPFFNHIKNNLDPILTFPDHHDFTKKDIENIREKAQNNLIITTEKDYVRLIGVFPEEQLYYLPIKSAFVTNGATFDQIILNYVESGSRNS